MSNWIYVFVNVCELTWSFLWVLFKGVAPVAVAIAAIVINNKRAEERDKQSKRLEILLSWERNLYEKLEDFNGLIEASSIGIINHVNNFCRGEISAKEAQDYIIQITNELLRQGNGIVFLNESVQDDNEAKLNVPYFPYMVADLTNKLQDSMDIAVRNLEQLGENKSDIEIDEVVNKVADHIQDICGQVKYTITMIMREMTEKMLEMYK